MIRRPVTDPMDFAKEIGKERRISDVLQDLKLQQAALPGEMGEYKSGSGSSYSFGNVTHIILDTPGTTSRTYKVAYRSIDGSTVGVQGSSSYTRSYILLQEIVA